MRLCSSLPANRSVCARRARGEEVCRSRWTEHPPGGDFHLAISGDFEMAIDNFKPLPEIVVRAPCRQCNSGWMADIENKAKDLLTRFLWDQQTDLDTAAQIALATWVYKTGLMLECAATPRRRWS